MKHLNKMALLAALAAAAVAAAPVCAQSRSHSGASHSSSSSHSASSSSRSSSSSGRSYSSSGSSRSSSSSSRSYSSSSSSRSSSPSRSYSSSGSRSYSSGNTVTSKGLGSTSRSSSYSSPSRSSSSGRSGSYSSPSRSSSYSAPRSSSSSSAARSSASGRSGSYSSPSRSSSYSAPRSSSSSSAARSSASGRSSYSAPRSASPAVSRSQAAGRGSNGTGVARPRPGTPVNFNGSTMPGQVRMGADRNVHRVPPRLREPIDYHHPIRFSCHGPHYYGYRVALLPPGHLIHYYWGRPYYFCDGIWYRHYIDHYYVCRPPFGYVFDIIDDLAFTACNFAYYNSVYNTYRTINDNAQLIAEQNAQIAANNALIAEQNQEIALNSDKAAASYELANGIGAVQKYADASQEYYYQDGVFYSKTADGKYVVVVPPAGALVQELPDDYDVIEIDGKEYYKVDDTIFRTSIVHGAVYFEVVGQLTGELADKYDLNK